MDIIAIQYSFILNHELLSLPITLYFNRSLTKLIEVNSESKIEIDYKINMNRKNKLYGNFRFAK